MKDKIQSEQSSVTDQVRKELGTHLDEVRQEIRNQGNQNRKQIRAFMSNMCYAGGLAILCLQEAPMLSLNSVLPAILIVQAMQISFSERYE